MQWAKEDDAGLLDLQHAKSIRLAQNMQAAEDGTSGQAEAEHQDPPAKLSPRSCSSDGGVLSSSGALLLTEPLRSTEGREEASASALAALVSSGTSP